MKSTLVGMFDSQTAASEARSQLLAAGFGPAAVSMSNETDTSSSSRESTASSGGQQDEGVIARFFGNLFGSDDSDDQGYGQTYREAVRRGSYVVSVQASSEDELDRAERILNAAGAVDVDERAQAWRQEGWSGSTGSSAYSSTGSTGSAGGVGVGGSMGSTDNIGSTASMGRTSGDMANTGSDLREGDTRTLKEVEEELKVGKRVVARGGVRIFSRVVEVPVEESVSLREERAEITRRAVDRPATEADFAAFKEGSIEVRESSEEAVVSKTARVVGEVEIGKTVTEREETVRDTVRQTRVDVEEIEGGRGVGQASQRQGVLQGQSAMPDQGIDRDLDGDIDRDSTRSTSRTMGSDVDDDHPLATGAGAVAGGVAAGAAVGTVAGPVGTAVGAAVGAVAGGLAGHGVAEEVDDDADDDLSKARRSDTRTDTPR
jgi:stress response protein YsnF